ncbi:putative reverse transcriptase domain-containing protein [Tanacetum coccineum]
MEAGSSSLNWLQNDTNERTTRASPATITTTTPVTNAQLKALINQGVADALVAHDVDRSWNDNDSHNSGTGSRRKEHTARECTYTNFLKCQPMNFKGTEGVVGLTQWFERMETLFNISNCVVENQVKFATCTLHGAALIWWKSHVKTVGQDAAHIMPWNTLMKMITAKYCPRDKIKKLEMEIRELKSDKIEKYVGGLPNMIHESVMASKSKTMQDAVEFAIELMDKKTHTFIERQTENKNKFKDTSRNNQNQQQQNKRQNTGRAYTAGVLPNATSVIELATWPVTVLRSLQNDSAATNQGALGQVRKLIALSAEHRTNPDLNVFTGMFLLNNRYASILFDIGANRSFMSTEFRSQIDTTPTALYHYYDVELADGRIIRNKKEHEEHLKAIPEFLKKEELYAKFSKCEFWIPKIQFLDHVIDSQGIHVDPAKIESIKD